MNANAIPQYEATFKNNGVDSHGRKHVLKPSSIAIPGENDTLNYTLCTPENNDQSFFYPEQAEKEKIVLHFTAGYLKGDIGTLTTENNHVSVPFVIARDGEIYNLWSSRNWSYHLGRGAIGGNTIMSKNSIAIEISNIGYLRKINNNLVTAYSDNDVYCTLAEEEYYTYLDNGGFRGQEYYASFTNEQYESIISLLRYLTATYSIPRAFLPEEKRYGILSAAEAKSFKGILSHVNFRTSGKWDLGPAFDWERLINGLA